MHGDLVHLIECQKTCQRGHIRLSPLITEGMLRRGKGYSKFFGADVNLRSGCLKGREGERCAGHMIGNTQEGHAT